MTSIDWHQEIVNGVIIHQRLAELDTAGLWTYHLPEVAASEDEIASVERKLGYQLDPQYRQFLLCANGWRSFIQAIDIMGTRQLLGGGVMRPARAQLAAIDPELFERDVGFAIGDALPVAASDNQTDMFLIGLPWSAAPGIVVWFAGYTIDRFSGFDEFYLSMLDYNRLQVERFEGRA